MKDKIAKTCVQMLRTRSMDEITVCDVAKQCGISRQAFYYYFENIESALLYAAEGMLDYLRQKCTEIREPDEAIRFLTRSYRDQYDLLRNLIQSKSHLRIKRHYHDSLYSIVSAQFAWNMRDAEPEEMEIRAAFIAYGLGGLLYERCSDPELDTDKLADEIYRYIFKNGR